MHIQHLLLGIYLMLQRSFLKEAELLLMLMMADNFETLFLYHQVKLNLETKSPVRKELCVKLTDHFVPVYGIKLPSPIPA